MQQDTRKLQQISLVLFILAHIIIYIALYVILYIFIYTLVFLDILFVVELHSRVGVHGHAHLADVRVYTAFVEPATKNKNMKN